MKNKKKLITVIIGLAILIAGIISAGIYLETKQQKKTNLSNATSDQTQTTQNIVEKVGKLAYLPQDEIPVIAIVSDLSKLKGQPFFSNAKAGDIVLFYNNAKKAILYDPNDNKIVEMRPMLFSAPPRISTDSGTLFTSPLGEIKSFGNTISTPSAKK
ncbi:hypothetical protein M1271_02480 [Patescibacteria group bacterium]|nr:hypothetical protein [Patescibacteria group bacterium]MCL5797645.1 hypothetical protein [Patescibacteria group bacterium]